MFKKKAQAAMEFLMTYGWAILVVLIVIGALSYFGVLNPANLLPDKCLFGAGIGTCEASITPGTSANTAKLQISFTNGFGKTMNVDPVNVIIPSGDLSGCGPATVDGLSTVASIPPGQSSVIAFDNCAGYNSGQKTRATVEITYALAGGAFDHKISGDVSITAQ